MMAARISIAAIFCVAIGSAVSARAADFGEAEQTRQETLAPAFAALKTTPQAPDPASAWPLGFDAEVPPLLRTQILSDLDFVASLEGPEASPLHREFFGPMAGGSYRRFFLERVGSIGMSDCGDSTSLACVLFWTDRAKIRITPLYESLNLPQLDRVMHLFHEARHTEAEHHFWLHSVCPTPFLDADGREIRALFSNIPLAGLLACDETPKGAYAVGIVLMKNLSKFCSNCTGKVKMDAGFYADETMKRIVGTSAVQALRQDLYR